MNVLPTEFSARMRDLLGTEYPLYEDSFCVPAVRAFRVNTNKISVKDFERLDPFHAEKIPYVDTGYYLGEERVGNHPYHHAGMIYVQDPGAMAPVACLDISPNWRILDLCAAPGGKSSQLRNQLGEEGILISNEIVPSRCQILTGNMERLGFRNTVTTCMEPARLTALFPKYFDLVMVDAPCSGEGMFRKDENAISEWSRENVLRCAQRQANILRHAAEAVSAGGYLIYATCTFSLEENEMVVDAFLREHPDFELLPVKESVRAHTSDGIAFDGCCCANLTDARRFYPHKSRGEGQFMALLHHMGEAVPAQNVHRAAVKMDARLTEFLEDVLTEYDRDHVTVYRGSPVYLTPALEMPKEGVIYSCGVTIGELRKNYVSPHHQFFMAMGHRFRRKLELAPNDPRLEQFLHGEELQTELPNGWAVITTQGCTVGGVKISNGRAKNHYPKGLRTLK